ncbi:FAD-dependent oxidoreductase [Trebonia kvetii]|uniref:FAD-dependent oxidoreductase n=1 Tax=Trebonia kvetii TaxID=2480626 RepID=UPI001FE46F17|nr:FAD-dependent oxidoreductase [Trebonia kvetii]
MTVRADLIIVGAGLAGAAAAWRASGRGASVVVLEQFGPAHRNGSSHGSARIFRRAYPDPLYVRLTGEAKQQWHALEWEAADHLLTLTGGIDFGVKRDPEHLHAVLTGNGVAAELLPAREAARRWPQFDFAGAGPVMFHEDCGVLDPDRAIAAMLRVAAAKGADIRFDTPVTRLEPGGDGAIVHTGGETFTAPVAVIAAGAWIAPLMSGLAELPPLTVTQQQVFHFAPLRPADASAAQSADRSAGRPAEQPPGQPWPVFIVQDEEDNCYGLPGGRDGEVPGAIKIGEHSPGTITTAAGRDFRVDPASRDRVRGFVARRVPGLDARPVNEVTCLYTSTDNEDFILDRPGSGPFVIASPCSGHGAKFAPLLGEIIAGLAAGEPAAEHRFTLAAHLAR